VEIWENGTILARGREENVFCNKRRDDLLHYLEECEEAKWFRGLGRNKEEIWDKVWSEDLDERKGEVLVKIWKEKEEIRRKRESEKVKG